MKTKNLLKKDFKEINHHVKYMNKNEKKLQKYIKQKQKKNDTQPDNRQDSVDSDRPQTSKKFLLRPNN